jgi:hypothetical protein
MPEQPNRVSVTDVDMPFLSMVRFMVKWAIAAIPAMLLLMILGAIFWGMLLGFFTSLGAKTSGASDRASPSAISTGRAVGDSKPVAPQADDPIAKAYLSKISVRNVRVGESVLGETGAFGEIKNEGDSTLKEVEITIFCLGPDGRPVFEKQYTPVLESEFSLSDANKPLKPGYSRKFGVKLDDAPTEWNKKVTVSVTGVKF